MNRGGDARPLAVAVMGPTASGKTALAVRIARQYDGEVVSVDSALVYRGLDIGTAKPDLQERGGIPHHLIDTHDPWQPCSAAEYAQLARQAIDGIVARKRVPVLAGGTGLYFQALWGGLAPMPAADPAIRAELHAQAQRDGWPALHARLAQVDPQAAARIHPSDPQRIQRALEVHRLTGRPISHWQQQAPIRRLPVRLLKLVLAPNDRALLHGRIARRFDTMLQAGFLDEVRRLRQLPQLADHPAVRDLPAMRAVGYRQAWEHIDGDVDADEFRLRAIAATRQLAKRQLTWLRSQLDARWFDPQQDIARIDAALALFLGPSQTG